MPLTSSKPQRADVKNMRLREIPVWADNNFFVSLSLKLKFYYFSNTLNKYSSYTNDLNSLLATKLTVWL